MTPVHWSHEKSPPLGSFLATSGTEGQALAIGVVSVEPRAIAAQSGVLGIAVGQTDDGPRVDQVLEELRAAKAGLRVNDVIVRINDRVVTTREALIDTVGGFRPGDRVRLKVRRGEDVLDISTTLGNRSIGVSRDFQNRLGGELSERRGDSNKRYNTIPFCGPANAADRSWISMAASWELISPGPNASPAMPFQLQSSSTSLAS